MDLFEEVQLDNATGEVIARGLVTIAEVDGMEERERDLIESFWRESTGGKGRPLALQEREAIAADDLAVALKGSAERRLFIKTAILLTWADGEVSPEEKTVLLEFASALGFDHETMNLLEGSVKDYLNQMITGQHPRK
jgi:tellurite resistance protein